MSFTDIYLANGHISELSLLVSSNKVADFPRQSDQPSAVQWRAITEGVTSDGQIVTSLSNTGKYVGGFTGAIKFQVLTPEMFNYLYVNIMGSRPVAKATVYAWHPRTGATPYHVELKFPLGDGELGGQRYAEHYISNVIFNFSQGTQANYGRAYGRGFSVAWG
jgi:hypothetical protein